MKKSMIVTMCVLAGACAHMRDISSATAEQIREGAPAAVRQGPAGQQVVVNQPAFGFTLRVHPEGFGGLDSTCAYDPVLCRALMATGGYGFAGDAMYGLDAAAQFNRARGEEAARLDRDGNLRLLTEATKDNTTAILKMDDCKKKEGEK